MKVLIRMFAGAEGVVDRLRRDGWRINREAADEISVRHAGVNSEHEARERFYALGLLTSGKLRIEFPIGADMGKALSAGPSVN